MLVELRSGLGDGSQGRRSPPTTKSSCGHCSSICEKASPGTDAGEIDVFDLDDLIHRYKRSARELWKFCGSSGSEWERTATALAQWREQGDEPDWWQAGQPRGRRP